MKVSILLPVYNNQSDITKAITSVINQTYKNWELIIIDDCSTDSTLNTITNYIKDLDYDIKIIINEVNQGVFISVNKGLALASGELIARLDSDDTYVNTMLEKSVMTLSVDKNLIATQSYYLREYQPKAIGEITLVYYKSIINEIGYYDSVRFCADSEFLARVVRKYGRHRIKLLPEILYFAKHRESSLTTSENTSNKPGTSGKIIRNNYVKQYTIWHRTTKNLYMPFPMINTNRPFPIDSIMMP